jgi:hypothetical protein
MSKVQYLGGRRFSHSSAELTILKSTGASEIFVDYDSIDYSDRLEVALVRGANRGPLGITAGDYEAGECNVSMGKSSFQRGIVVAIGDGWMGSDISLTVSYNDVGEPICTDRIKGVILGAEDSSAVGPDPVRTKLIIKALWISRNGVYPLKNMIK